MSSEDSKEASEAQWLRTTILPEILKTGKLVENYTQEKEHLFKINDIKISFISVEEAFMLTNCYRANVSFEYNGIAHSAALVVKKTPQLPQDVFDSINFGALFSNEIITYTVIMPTIQALIARKIHLPKFYYGDLQSNCATVIFEDFSTSGWQLSKQKFALDLELAFATVKYLGNFHGMCFAIKEKNHCEFENLMKQLKEARFANSVLPEDWEIQQKISFQRLVKVTNQYENEVPEEFLQTLRNLLKDPFTYVKKLIAVKEPMATLCHGDFLRNNIAFKFTQDNVNDKNANVSIDAMMFDLQTMRYGSPMIDLTVFLALSTFANVRNDHFEALFNAYCDELGKIYMDYTKEELPQFLSYDSLIKEYVRFLTYSINITAFFLPALIEPIPMTSEELLLTKRTIEEVTVEVMERGGETADRELAHQVAELYKLSKKYCVDLNEGIN